ANPTSDQGVWTSLNGDLRIAEFIAITYDPLNHVLIGGTQDNGSSVQSAPGNLGWRNAIQGDGGYAQAEGSPDGTSVTYYQTYVGVNDLSRERRDSSGNILERLAPVALAGWDRANDPTRSYQPYAVNRVAPNRLLFGTGNAASNGNLYESTNRGDT